MRCVAASNHRESATAPTGRALLRALGPLLLLALLGIWGCSSSAPPAAEFATQAPAGLPGAPLAGGDGIAGAPVSEGDPGWLAPLLQGIAEGEYRASENAEGLQAPNRRHDLRTYFEASGIRVHDRTAAGSPALLGLALVGVGRGAALSPVAPGEVVGEGARVEIRRPGLVEWYANSPAGLEQGFTLLERPDGDGALALELAVAQARASHRGDQVIFETPTGRQLTYAKLAAADAEGRELAAHLDVTDAGRLRIVLEDGGATYPVTIDPLITATVDTRIESSQAGSVLGFSVSAAGDVNNDGFADVIVGVPFYDAGEVNEGVAFVYEGATSGLVNCTGANPQVCGDGAWLARIESNQANAQLGFSVSGAGDVNDDGFDDVIVGSPFYDAGQLNEGAAFVYRGGPNAISGCFFFLGRMLCTPTHAAAQLESDQLSAWMGYSVSGAGDVNDDGFADVIVGAYHYAEGQDAEGAAFVFLGSGGSGIANCVGSGPPRCTPIHAATQLESDQVFAALGASVSDAGDVNDDGFADVIVGAPYYTAGEDDEGAAFVFLGSASGIADGGPATAAAQLESNQVGAWMGASVSAAGDVNGDDYADVIVGAPYYNAGQGDEGAAFVFLGGAAGIPDGDPTTAATQLESNQASAFLGISVSGAGDVNDDGYADVIVGAHGYDRTRPKENQGTALVFLGSASGIADGDPSTAAARLTQNQVGAGLGYSVSGAGDVNNDGYADVIVGAYLYDMIIPPFTLTDAGIVNIYRGGALSSVGVVPEPGFTLGLTAGLALLALLHRRR